MPVDFPCVPCSCCNRVGILLEDGFAVDLCVLHSMVCCDCGGCCSIFNTLHWLSNDSIWYTGTSTELYLCPFEWVVIAMASKKPADLARDRLNNRIRRTLIQAGKKIGKLTNSEKKTPSQRRSESGRKKEATRAGVKVIDVATGEDCHNCSKYPCGKTIKSCGERSMVHRCLGCGQRVLHRIDPSVPWERCPVCVTGDRK